MNNQDKNKSRQKKGILGYPKKSKVLFIVNVSPFLKFKTVYFDFFRF